MTQQRVDIERIKKSVQVEDDHIILGEPILINKYGKTIKIEQIKWKMWERFSYCMGMFLSYYYNVCNISKLPDNLNDLQEFRDNVRTTASGNKAAMKYLYKICGFTGLKTWWMKRKFTIDDFVEVFLYVYIYNIKGVKLSCKKGLKMLGSVT